MAFKAGNTIALYGAFYKGNTRITDLSPYTIKCRLSTLERRLIATLDERVETAEDGSVCVILNPEDTKSLKGRVLYTFALMEGESSICEITNDFDIYE